MPTRPLIADETLVTITDWLNSNLNDEKRVKACCKVLNNVPKTKGIYFWFMHPEGYNELSKYFNIEHIEPKYTRNIDGVLYDLVYLGTAGVRNNSNGVNNSHLRERLKWHLCDNKNVSALCSGAMSTYRRTIGALISDDLIADNIQDIIDELLCKYFFIYYIEYQGTFLEVRDIVNSDEDILINVIRPIFNLKKNPNAENPNHITFEIKQRRQIVENNSKIKWCSDKPNTKTKVKTSKPNNPQNTNSVVLSEERCVTFTVNVNQSIHTVVNGIPNLPIPCIFICRNSINPNEVVYARNNGNWRNTADIYRYFSRSDDNYSDNHGYNSNLRWSFIQEEMLILGIETIMVTICPINQ